MLATRFSYNSRNLISSDRPIDETVLRAAVPSIFAEAAHDSRSSRYTYVPTSEILRGLQKEGFQPFYAVQAKARDASRREFTKHMLRLRHVTQIAESEVPEIILVNSHDGTSAYQMLAGMFRFVCCNGMIVGDSIDEVRVPHKGDIVGRVIDGAYTVLDEFGRVRDAANTMKAITLKEPEQQAFARAALVAKYGENDANAFPIGERQVLQPRRHDDVGADLWRVFNRAQENLVRGGLRGRASTGRRTTTREVRGISENVQLNRALWTLAEEMTKLKTAA
jgi:hypothetical protein